MIDDANYNAFARGIANSIRCRSKGLDAGSARIVNGRPSEHILSGFLTPRSIVAPPRNAADDDFEADDLPRDAAFELTSIGLEWRGDKGALSRLSTLSLSVDLNVYVRAFPHSTSRRSPVRGGASMQQGPAQVREFNPLFLFGAGVSYQRCRSSSRFPAS